MQKILLLTAILLISSCSVFVAGRMSDERKELYNYNNDKEYCQKNPDMCIGNIPKY